MDVVPEYVIRVLSFRGKTYYQVPQIIPDDEIGYDGMYREHIQEYSGKNIECFGCPMNAKASSMECNTFHGFENKCSNHPDYIYINKHSLKRYVQLRVIQRMT
jgi:hypothetical protein